MNRKSLLGILIGLMVFLLVSCSGVEGVEVAPITGLPQGTDGNPWWNDTVFYEVFVRSFKDSNGDGIGDFKGLIEQLDYLNDGDPATSTDLGVTGLWLMPINPSPSYHGYDVTDYYTVNEQYGTLEDFRMLVEEAHKRGIRVIIDLVMNHTSSAHSWFVESQKPDSPYRDWYIWSEENPGMKGPMGQQVWYPNSTGKNGGYYYAVFWDQMPDLNYTNPAVVEEMKKVASFWLEDVGVDGFRLDAAKHIIEEDSTQENTKSTHDWWKDFRAAYKSANPEAMTVGEVWSSNDQAAKYVQGDELDLVFDFDLANSMLGAATFSSPNDFAKALQRSIRAFPDGQFATFLTNHDIDRTMNKVGNEELKARVAGSLLLTAPGVPFVYYGEEIGLSGAKPDEYIRLPMQWSDEENAGFSTAASSWRPPYPNYKERNVKAQQEDPQSLLNHYQALIQLRNRHAALRVGDFVEIKSDNRKLLSFLRVSEEETLLILINAGKESVSDFNLTLEKGPLTGSYQPALLLAEGFETTPKIQAPQLNQGGGFDNFNPLTSEGMPPAGVLVIQLQPQK